MDREIDDNLREYYRRFLQDVRGLKQSTVKHYDEALKKISQILIAKEKIKNSIYEIRTLDRLLEIMEELKRDKGFLALDKRGHSMYSACMNNYLKDQNSTLKATPLKGVSLDDLCKTYVRKDIPVMIWATANLQEPFVKRSWIINYVDENSTKKIGDTMEWLMHEHCMVLIGYDNDNYYMCDSVEGKVYVFPKEPFEDLYNQLGTQAIVVQ